MINVICDNALVSGMALGHRRVERAMVNEVCDDLRLLSGPSGWTTAAEPSPGSADGAPAPRVAQYSVPEEAREDSSESSPETESDSPGRFNFRFRWKAATVSAGKGR